MRQEDRLKEKYGTDPGLRVPENYFVELNVRIMNNLPPYKEAPKRVPLTLWQRVKPYAYLAAMFAGIWMMMHMFHNLSATTGSMMLDNPPEAIVQMIENGGDEFVPVFQSDTDYDVVHEVSGNYDSFDEFESDFGYELSPEYSSLKINVLNNNTIQPV